MNNKEKHLEQLGHAEHERWAAWVRSHLQKGHKQPNGDVCLSASYVRYLEELCAKSYEELTSADRDKDKKVVYEFLGDIPFIRENLPDCPFGPVEDFWNKE